VLLHTAVGWHREPAVFAASRAGELGARLIRLDKKRSCEEVRREGEEDWGR
jgi:hypothetical protein